MKTTLYSAAIASALSVLLLSLAVAHAQQTGAVKVTNRAEVETTITDAAGKVTRVREPAGKVVPGTEVIYTTTFANLGSAAAGDIVLNNPVPNDTLLVAGSVFGATTTVTYSLDGKVFAAPDKLTVKNKDGKDVAATAADYAHIRWTYRGELAAGKSGEVGFRVVIK